MTLSKAELGRLIKSARQEKAKKIGSNYTQNDLAKAVDRSRSYIGDLESGRTYPSYRLLSKIAEACEVELNYFSDFDKLIDDYIDMSTDDEQAKSDMRHIIRENDWLKPTFLSGEEKDQITYCQGEPAPDWLLNLYNNLNLNEVDYTRIFKVPVLGSIRAGQPIYANQVDGQYMYVDPRSMKISPKDELFYLRVQGDSMYPNFFPGDMVLIRKQSAVDDGEIAAVLLNGNEACLKKLYNFNEEVLLCSINTAYEPIKASTKDVIILGKAVAMVRTR